MIIVYTSQFKRDYKRIKKQRKDLRKLEAVIERLITAKPLASKYQDHPLTGQWHGYRDCHLEPDWLLIYKITTNKLILARTGSHSELF